MGECVRCDCGNQITYDNHNIEKACNLVEFKKVGEK